MTEEKTLTLNINADRMNFHRDKKFSVEIKKKRRGLTLDLDKSNKFVNKKPNTTVTNSKLTDMEFKARVKALQEALDQKEKIVQNKALENKPNDNVPLRNNIPLGNNTKFGINENIKRESNNLFTKQNINDPIKNINGKINKQDQQKELLSEKKQPDSQIFSDKKLINENDDSKPIKPTFKYKSPKNQIFKAEEFKKTNKYNKKPEFSNKKTWSQNQNNNQYKSNTNGHTNANNGYKPGTPNKNPNAISKKTNFTQFDKLSKYNEQTRSNYSEERKNNHVIFKDDVFKKPSDKQYKNKTETNKKSSKKHLEADKKYLTTKLKGTSLDRALNDENEFRERSLASVKRARSKLKNTDKSDTKMKVTRDVAIPETIAVGELATRMAVKAAEVIKYLMSVGTMATINQVIDGDTAEIICSYFGHNPKRITDQESEKELNFSQLDTIDNLSHRAPIIAVMGHVDHGKTTLLDTLRQTAIAQKEAGGITQHVAAYQISTSSGKKITFIDTPGHAAFNNIRERGAKLTDIIVLVVAADDGIKEQTIEVIKYAKLQKTPIIVAINKIDKPEINIEKVKMDLMQHDILLEEFGGDILSCEISAKKNINLNKLLDTILLQAEVLDLKANANRVANGVVLETKIDKGKGIMTYCIVQGGKLHIGDILVAGTAYGKVKALADSNGNKIKEAMPSEPINIIGFNSTPLPGDEFAVVNSEQKAKEITTNRLNLIKSKQRSSNIASTHTDQEQILNVFLKADVFGSIEAIETSLKSIDQSEIKLKLIGKDIGIISESDLNFIKNDKNTVLVGFNVGTTDAAKELAKLHKLKIINNKIIYQIIEEIKDIMSSMLPSIIEEQYLGTADIKKLFVISKIGTIAGCYVSDGTIKRVNSKMKVMRNGKCLFEGEIKSMKHEKDEIKESKQGHECGILSNYNDYQVGDKIECYEIVEKKRKIN